MPDEGNSDFELKLLSVALLVSFPLLASQPCSIADQVTHSLTGSSVLATINYINLNVAITHLNSKLQCDAAKVFRVFVRKYKNSSNFHAICRLRIEARCGYNRRRTRSPDGPHLGCR
jgi:hypothetical protein